MFWLLANSTGVISFIPAKELLRFGAGLKLRHKIADYKLSRCRTLRRNFLYISKNKYPMKHNYITTYDQDAEVIAITTEKGNNAIILDGYKYSLKKITPFIYYYRCTQKKCCGSIHYIFEEKNIN
jgi:hypothetical protein